MNIVSTGMGWIGHTPGGLNRYFADYVRALNEAGHRATGLMTANGEATGVPPYFVDVQDEPGRRSVWTRAQSFRRRASREIRGRRADVFNPHFALYSAMVSRGSIPEHVPIVTHFHGPWAEESFVEEREPGIGPTMRRWLKKNVELLAYRRSDRFIVLSRYFRDVLANGYGIPEEIRPRIFESFLSGRSDGTGLGLGIAQRIVKDHHGELRLVSTSPAGTTMRVTLPLARG